MGHPLAVHLILLVDILALPDLVRRWWPFQDMPDMAVWAITGQAVMD